MDQSETVEAETGDITVMGEMDHLLGERVVFEIVSPDRENCP
jgi:hypothetical protein